MAISHTYLRRYILLIAVSGESVHAPAKCMGKFAKDSATRIHKAFWFNLFADDYLSVLSPLFKCSDYDEAHWLRRSSWAGIDGC